MSCSRRFSRAAVIPPMTDGESREPNRRSRRVRAASRANRSARFVRTKKPAPSAGSEKSEPRDESETESEHESEEHRESEAEREDSEGEGNRAEAAERRVEPRPARNRRLRSRADMMRGGGKSNAHHSSDTQISNSTRLAMRSRRSRDAFGCDSAGASDGAQGRLDFRRTIRASIQRGGALSDLRFRARRPRHIDLVILADISGSVRYSSTLMLELIAGAANFFRRVRSFVFIDRFAEAEFEQNHLIMTPPLDLYARSDFGRVLGELWERRGELLNRATVLVIMGDGRNNRRPARADLLREMARLCRAVIWLIPGRARAMGHWRQRDFSVRARGVGAGAVAKSARTRTGPGESRVITWRKLPIWRVKEPLNQGRKFRGLSRSTGCGAPRCRLGRCP